MQIATKHGSLHCVEIGFTLNVKMKITNKLSRLSLLDAGFVKVTRSQGGLEIVFNCARLHDCAEEGVLEPIVLEQTSLKVSGVSNEKFSAYTEKEEWTEMDVPTDIETCWELISESELDDNQQSIQLSGMVLINNEWAWVEWAMKYEACEAAWTTYRALAEHQQAKLT